MSYVVHKIKFIARSLCPEFMWYWLSALKKISSISRAKGLRSIGFLKEHDEVVVLGNGPSLKSDLNKISENSENSDFVCVNNFSSSPYYVLLKPSKYIFLDEYFFSDNAHLDWVKQREETFKLINEKTTWKCQLFIPSNADNKVLKDIISNKNIEIINIRVAPCDMGYKWLTNVFYETGYFGPYQDNVLIYAIYISVWAGHKNIKIYGADLSFHKDVEIDQSNNQLKIMLRHFNLKDTFEPLMKNPEKIEPFTMSELMETTARTFKAHKLIAEYARQKEVSIENCSSYSLIDVYDRPSIKSQVVE